MMPSHQSFWGARMSHIETIRQFNRFYTRKIGVLREGLLESSYSLTEVRVMYELAQKSATASALCRELDLDMGYLSRILSKFEKAKLIKRTANKMDARQSTVSLTAHGRAVFEPLNQRARDQISALITDLPEYEQQELIHSMQTIERIFSQPGKERPNYNLRPHKPGDMGWIVHRHGVLYAQEYGWDCTFEALVADIVAQFIKSFDPTRECCWVADTEYGIVGSVFLVKESDDTAKLRLLLVEPQARGTGLGSRLVQECKSFARGAGYQKISLWTNDVLHSARRIYEREGFHLVSTQAHHSFGQELVGQTWELDLG
jgi:DNA-binding MarR family transcriptional regulator/GNAT superfamily N-acetyltransferase